MKAAKSISLIISLVFVLSLINLREVNANFVPQEITDHISILYPPHPITPNAKGYENNTIILQVNVVLLGESPALRSISCSLDGGPLIYFRNITSIHVNDYDPPGMVDFTSYNAAIELKDLSEGNHTVTAYANGMSTTREFTVNSYYQVTIIKVLSPVNQTYSGSVPLLFNANGEVKSAHYFMYKFKRNFDGGYDSVFEKRFTENTTVDNLSNGNYILHLYVTTEKGEAMTTVHFSVIQSITVIQPTNLFLIVTGVITSVVIITSLLLWKNSKKKLASL